MMHRTWQGSAETEQSSRIAFDGIRVCELMQLCVSGKGSVATGLLLLHALKH